jgi:hypothetical protein
MSIEADWPTPKRDHWGKEEITKDKGQSFFFIFLSVFLNSINGKFFSREKIKTV